MKVISIPVDQIVESRMRRRKARKPFGERRGTRKANGSTRTVRQTDRAIQFARASKVALNESPELLMTPPEVFDEE